MSDLPENVIRSLEQQAEYARRQQLLKSQSGGLAAEPLPQWPGVAAPPEKLRREELYDDDE